jgi:ketosteroid isomerase-like protein
MAVPESASAQIRILRAESNAAIAGLDAERVVAFMAPDVTVAVAGGPVLRGLAANRAAFAEQMADAAFRGYVRTPDAVEVTGARATERGQWTGRWQTRAGPITQRGRYSAEWSLTPLGWRITSETYVPA